MGSDTGKCVLGSWMCIVFTLTLCLLQEPYEHRAIVQNVFAKDPHKYRAILQKRRRNGGSLRLDVALGHILTYEVIYYDVLHICMCFMTHSCVRYESSIRVALPIYMCASNSCGSVRHDTPRFVSGWCVYAYIYTYVHAHIYMYISIYIYIYMYI